MRTRSLYEADGDLIKWVDVCGDFLVVARCDRADEAVDMLNRAHHLNDVEHRYTASARLSARVETLPGFTWTEEA